TLVPNPHYLSGHADRPNIEILYIEESTTALDLYRLKKLDFIPELAFSDIAAMKTQKDFFRTPMARFDYIGFGDGPTRDINLRKALALSVDYNEFAKVFDALGRPGCTGLPSFFVDKDPCLNFDLKEAKKAL